MSEDYTVLVFPARKAKRKRKHRSMQSRKRVR
jgi:hypothetical protein